MRRPHALETAAAPCPKAADPPVRGHSPHASSCLVPPASCHLSAAPRLPSAHRPPESGGVRFSPQLSERKREAIARLGMGTENKVVLRWAVKDIFWPAARPYLQCTDQRFRFLNLHHFGKAGVLLVMCAGAPRPPPSPLPAPP